MMALWSAGDASGRWMLSGMRLTYSTYYAYFLTHAGDASRGAAAESHLYVGARRTAQLRLMLRLARGARSSELHLCNLSSGSSHNPYLGSAMHTHAECE